MDIQKVTSIESSQSIGTKQICILVMDDDPTYLNIVAKMLRNCSHKVLHFEWTTDAFDAIRKRKDKIEAVLTNVHSSDTNGFGILKHIEKELNLPTILLSVDGNKRSVSRGRGVKLYFVKSLSVNDINNLWQNAHMPEKGKRVANAQVNNADQRLLPRGYEKQKRKELKETSKQNEVIDREDSPSEKKPRVVWTNEMHHEFLKAIQQLGHEKAFPKKIVEVMNLPGLTRENVASHLQKYRMCLKRAHERMQSSSSTYGLNLRNDVKETCFQSSNSSLNHFTFSQENSWHPHTQNTLSIYPMPQNNSHYMKSLQVGSAQVDSTYVSSGNRNFRIYGDETKNILFSVENGGFSCNSDQPSSTNTCNTYVGYRLTPNGKSVELGHMGMLGTDEIGRETVLTQETNSGGSLVISQEQPSWSPLLPPLFFGAEADLEALLKGTEITGHEILMWDNDFDDTLLSDTV